MPDSPSRFRAVVGFGWVLLACAALVFARIKSIPAPVALLLATAFLAEFPFYISAAFPKARVRSPWLLALSGVLPWLVYSAPLGLVTLQGALMLTGIVLLASFWFVVLPPGPLTDAGFLLLLAAVRLSKVFNAIYLSPVPKLELFTLGQVMLIRTAATSVLSFRGRTGIEFRFLPNRAEWLAGLKWFAIGLPFIGSTLWALGLAQPRPHPNLALVLPQFFGILWVVAISEEFFFRGLLQQWLEDWSASPLFALIMAALLFGAVHLSVHFFPNWRYSICAALLGLFSGLAWRQTRTIQSAMVAHALGATVYRVFFV